MGYIQCVLYIRNILFYRQDASCVHLGPHTAGFSGLQDERQQVANRQTERVLEHEQNKGV